jgi:hypothetical protein
VAGVELRLAVRVSAATAETPWRKRRVTRLRGMRRRRFLDRLDAEEDLAVITM